ncbi:MAG: CrcB family protein [Armatimonadetes bacterium]|nr:CrcB family protein [Armatimonadota bacterium]MBS1711014.1 CrcB family protein [Armatimonadota bacterium]MBX3108686.1 CrcB family protein [Fimbriimonadaceae bacterium]
MDNLSPAAAYLTVGIGGAAGSMARFAVAQAFLKFKPDNPFLAVAVVNLVGSLLIGLVAGHYAQKNAVEYLLLVVGFLGGFTTFSSFSLDLFAMIQRHLYAQAALFAASQVVLGIGGAALGFAVTSRPG